jgi:hypothetical protein
VLSCLETGGGLTDDDGIATYRSVGRAGKGKNHVVAADGFYREGKVIARTKSALAWNHISIVNLRIKCLLSSCQSTED